MKAKIAIDPDVDKNGVAIMHNGVISYIALNFFELQDKLKEYEDCELYIEAGWLNHKKNFRYFGQNSRIASEVSARVGANHQVGKLIEQYAQYRNIPYQLVKPLRKIWKGKDGKITAIELNAILKSKGFEQIKRSNQDQRDAILILLKVL